jgi:quercetin dioxygenase-like cupin family protein
MLGVMSSGRRPAVSAESPLQEVLARVVAARAAAGAPSALAVVQVQAFPGQTTPLHVHDEDEVVRTLEGSVVVHTTEGPHTVDAGEARVIPLGVPHAVAAGTTGARYLSMSHVRSAEDYERFVRAVAVPDAGYERVPDEERALALAAQVNGISVLGPPGTPAVSAAAAVAA